jgi:hypothetical protein
MPELPDPHTAKLVQAIESYMENPPQDMPEGLNEQLTSLGQSLRGYGGEGGYTPGQREAMKATNGTGESFAVAGTGDDQPSPGQQEFDKYMEKAREAFHQQSPESKTNPVEVQ